MLKNFGQYLKTIIDFVTMYEEKRLKPPPNYQKTSSKSQRNLEATRERDNEWAKVE